MEWTLRTRVPEEIDHLNMLSSSASAAQIPVKSRPCERYNPPSAAGLRFDDRPQWYNTYGYGVQYDHVNPSICCLIS
jgi:hypothetical protein